ncbi:MAG: hypothetical protein ACUVXJ_14555 [Phycisphaerae bacterium]
MRDTCKHSLLLTQRGQGYALALAVLAMAAGCSNSNQDFRPEDQFGRIYYLDGAGNWGFGQLAVPQGLRDAGYRGRIVTYRWSATLNPLLDQTIFRSTARTQGKKLAREIEHYLAEYPNNEVHLIALSAGTGVAVWACEHLTPPAKIGNVVLLSSSLSSDYEMSRALANIRGTVFVYYYPNDGILSGPVQVLGTIDGTLGSHPAGLVGLRCLSSKIRNIPWSRRFAAYGWTGAHVSAVAHDFVQHVLSQHVLAQTHMLTAELAHLPKSDAASQQ